jgi:cyclophilin family peptidyl-prolyl cis-trans isomerase
MNPPVDSATVKRAAVLVPLFVLASVLAASCADKNKDATPATIIEDTSIGIASGETTPAPPVTVPLVAPTNKADCPATDGSAPQKRKFTKEPPLCIDLAKTYVATMETSEGTMVFDLSPAKAPHTVNSFVYLARQKYFDGLTFHRVLKGFVLQGGDPLGTGLGGPGYEFVDELPQAGAYKVGSLAMANSGDNTNGSQFFVISGPEGVALPPKYSLFGDLEKGKGEDVITKVDALSGSAENNGKPTKPVTIIKVTIAEK